MRKSLLFYIVRYKTIKIGGVGWGRTNIVYPEGPDLQSGDAHALASTTPNLVEVWGIEPHSERCKPSSVSITTPETC